MDQGVRPDSHAAPRWSRLRRIVCTDSRVLRVSVTGNAVASASCAKFFPLLPICRASDYSAFGNASAARSLCASARSAIK